MNQERTTPPINNGKFILIEVMVSLLGAASFLYLIFGRDGMDLTAYSFANAGDQRLNMLFHQWNLDWLRGAVPSDTSGYWDFYIFHPYRQSFALSSNHLGSLPIHFFLEFFTTDWFFRTNLWILLCYVLNYLSAYWATLIGLSRSKLTQPMGHLNHSLFATLVAASFGFSMVRVNYIDHAQTLPSFAAPWFLLWGYLALKQHQIKPLIGAIFLFVWQCYLDLHIGLNLVLISLLILCPYGLYILVARDWNRMKQHILFLGTFGLASLLLLTPLLLPYLETMDIMGTRPWHRGPALKSYFMPTHYSTLFWDYLPRSSNDGVVLPHYWFTPLAIVFLLVLLFQTVRGMLRRGDLMTLWILISVFAILVVYIDFMVHRSTLAHVIGLIPGLSSIRAPARFSIFLAPLFLIGGLIFIALKSKGKAWPKGPTVLGLMLLATMFGESATLKLNYWQRVSKPSLESVFQNLRGPAIFLPFGQSAYQQLDLMQYASQYKIRLGNGYSGFELPDFNKLIKAEKNGTPVEELVDYLAHTYYREVVVDTDRYPSAVNLPGPMVGRFKIIINQKPAEIKEWQAVHGYFPGLF